MGFEEDLARLEEIVRSLEDGRLTLEESLTAFSEGMNLSSRLNARLKEAEQRIMMVQKDAELALRPASELAPEEVK